MSTRESRIETVMSKHSRLGRDMDRAVLSVLAMLTLGFLAIAVTYVVGIRSKSAMVRDAARLFHRAVGNPIQMRSAGRPGTYTSVLRHEGRTTGRIYETPVWAAPTEDGFVIALVYGARTDWLKNVLASRAAAVVHEGATYSVERPEIVPMRSARAYFPAELQVIHRLIRVDRCLRVRFEVAKTLAGQGSPYPGQTGPGLARRQRPSRRLALGTSCGGRIS